MEELKRLMAEKEISIYRLVQEMKVVYHTFKVKFYSNSLPIDMINKAKETIKKMDSMQFVTKEQAIALHNEMKERKLFIKEAAAITATDRDILSRALNGYQKLKKQHYDKLRDYLDRKNNKMLSWDDRKFIKEFLKTHSKEEFLIQLGLDNLTQLNYELKEEQIAKFQKIKNGDVKLREYPEGCNSVIDLIDEQLEEIRNLIESAEVAWSAYSDAKIGFLRASDVRQSWCRKKMAKWKYIYVMEELNKAIKERRKSYFDLCKKWGVEVNEEIIVAN